uniref:DUF805 domain-containing protein n=1 Tax=Vallitalea okinawensis TaxID=2078660 RepID=UPI0038CD41BF
MFLFISIITVIIGTSLTVRRLHDLNVTGWLVLVNALIRIITLFFHICFTFIPGTKGPNKYGDDPLGVSLIDLKT